MGAGKYPEEIVERSIESYDGVEAQFPLVASLPLPAKPKLSYCPLCLTGYLEDAALNNHIAEKHGKQHLYLKVNDQVIRDVCWSRQPIKECRLVALKIDTVEVTICVDGHATSIGIRESSSLLKYLPKALIEGVIEIEAKSGQFSRNFTIYQGRQPTFRSERLDSVFQETLGASSDPSLTELIGVRDRCQRLGLNNLEDRYLTGVLEYCHGVRLEIKGKSEFSRTHLVRLLPI